MTVIASFTATVLRTVWTHRITVYWAIWGATTLASAFLMDWAVSSAPYATGPARLADRIFKREQLRSRAGVATLVVLTASLVLYILLSLVWEDFAGYDHSALTLFTLRGYSMGPPIWRNAGRFFPLGHQEFNLVRHFTHTIVGYHVFPAVQLFFLICLLLFIDTEISFVSHTAIVGVILLSPAIMISYTGLFFPERNVVFWLACLILFVQRFEQTRLTGWAVAAGVSAQIMMYYKETAFLLVAAFAAVRLLLHCRSTCHEGWDYDRLWDKEGRFNLILLSLSAVFLFFYVAAMFPHMSMQYTSNLRLPTTEIVASYVKMDALVFVFVVFAAARTYMILRRRVTPLPLWDGLAIGGAVYFIAYLRLGIFSAYYMAPVDLIAALYLGRFAAQFLTTAHSAGKIAVACVFCPILIQNASLSAFHLFEDKNLVHAKAEIADSVLSRYAVAKGNPVRLFFPFATPYVVMEFGSYLDYRGLAVEGGAEERPGRNSVVLVSRNVGSEGPCVPFRPVVCHPGTRPSAGDLVVVLPDDDASLVQVSSYQQQGERLFSYEPRPRVPEWAYPFVKRLRIASIAFARKELPDRWLHASVVDWK